MGEGVKMIKVLVLNGPNIQRLGTREPEIYGKDTFEDLKNACIDFGKQNDFEIDFRQTDDEVTIIKWLHEASDNKLPVVINPAAFTHYSYAMRDAAAMHTAPLIEVHISNPQAREEFRHFSVLAGVADGAIAGFGIDSYRLALSALKKLIK
jgi:3-dehydroquinate dehydratase-2